MMSGLHRILMVITLFSFWFIGFINEAQANSLGILLVLTVGLIHGANDLRIIGKLHGGKKIGRNYQLILYVISSLLIFLLFYLFPLIALFIFLLFSCYHFGEQHWLESRGVNSLKLSIFAFSYGLLIISMILKFNLSETLTVLKDITQLEVSPVLIDILFYTAAGMFLALALLLRKELFLNFASFIGELFLIAMLAVIFKISTLIWSFAFYFILWHAVPSLYSQIKVLYGNSGLKGILSYLKHSIIYWLIAVIGLIVTVYFLKENTAWIVSIFFPFIAALTIPHVLVMSKMFREFN